MPSFDTPGPITVSVDNAVGIVTIVATQPNRTTVDVTASDPGKPADVAAAERTRVEHTQGRLSVRTSGTWRRYSWRGDGGSTAVRIQCPPGANLTVTGPMVTVYAEGTLGQVRIHTSMGDVMVGETAALDARTGYGNVTAGPIDSGATVNTGTGAVRLDAVGGYATVKNSNGDSWLGRCAGRTEVKAANGNIAIDHARSDVSAKTANGTITLARVCGGDVVAETACGSVAVGVSPGTAAWLDLDTSCGQVINELKAATAPSLGNPVVRVRARTSMGDLTVTYAPTQEVQQ
ncbi:hypothetical protein FOS14_03080 [Skermania sp. ID1734]|uniref:DUF4097 family beta strand repeat-containing protein n=1 Tax=Skermania sp. ID1734 TaxID=2597516 RepID=UPI00117DB234|nr:hypothetical protein [Skermania sp. ID1734]TSE01539.1 hypothetical protein FOS14_03080 [Skermania sp. ID1734]